MASELPSSSMEHGYEVFLSFRGVDTRKGFTDHLYHHMVDAGLRVFKDNMDLSVGEEIASNLYEGIKRSKMSVPIFSKNYASSKWCLDELACIVECSKSRNQTVLPVFYDVTPTEIRHQTGAYAAAFLEHVKKYDGSTVEKWRNSLAQVSQWKGWELEIETAGHEGQLAKKIVAKVVIELKKAHLRVTEKLVGIDDHVKAVKDLLEMREKYSRKIVGLWVMGGIGKTTLAKFIYNQILDKFEFCSFLNDIREKSLEHNGLARLQSQLLFDLSKKELLDLRSVDEGVNELESKFCGKKVLILLDDVDQINQLNALAASLDWFGPGSRIIVTTRNRDVLDDLLRKARHSGIPQGSWWACYEVKEMNQEKALQLFCSHAFRQDTPEDEFCALSHSIVETTGGLPLALEVIGSFLSRKRNSIWEETLMELMQMPKQEVQERLKISYDGLDDEQKHMFLDVACFFIGEDIDVVVQVWKDRNFSTDIGKDVLLAMSLIKIGEDRKIWMHDQLRDLGREIVRKENCNEPAQRSRLWRVDEARDVLEKLDGSPKVEALCLRLKFGQNCRITDKQLTKLPNLRFLKLYHVDLAGDFQHILQELRWLRWRYSSPKRSPTFFCFLQRRAPIRLNLKKLLVLDLSFSKITDDCKLWSYIQRPVNLKVLYLSSCMDLRRTPNLSAFINLERLILDYCHRLEVIDPSVGKLENLTLLSMKNCWSVKKLSECIGNLKSLSELDLSGTRFPTLPSSICGLKNLQVLKVLESGISRLPDAIIQLEQLHLIDDSVCENLEENISEERWTLGVSMYLKLLKRLNGSEALQALHFSGYAIYHDKPQEHEQLEGLEAVQCLNVTGCGAFGKLPIPYNLKFLIHLDFDNCDNLQEVEGLDKLGSLQRLCLARCGSIKRLLNLSSLKFLERLECCWCDKLEELEGLAELEKLQFVRISGCKAMEHIPKLPQQMKSGSWCLDFEGCEKFELTHRDPLKFCSICQVAICNVDSVDADVLVDYAELDLKG